MPALWSCDRSVDADLHTLSLPSSISGSQCWCTPPCLYCSYRRHHGARKSYSIKCHCLWKPATTTLTCLPLNLSRQRQPCHLASPCRTNGLSRTPQKDTLILFLQNGTRLDLLSVLSDGLYPGSGQRNWLATELRLQMAVPSQPTQCLPSDQTASSSSVSPLVY